MVFCYVNSPVQLGFVFSFGKMSFSLKQAINNLSSKLNRPCNPTNLAVCRALFGLLMVLDIFKERGFPVLKSRWSDPDECRFPLFDFMTVPPLPWMCAIYICMMMGAIGIALGMAFRWSCAIYILSYWYIFFLDKSRWNNHSYLYGLISILMLFSSANNCWTVHGMLSKTPGYRSFPCWNYFALRGQIFLVYFIAGIKKMDKDWIGGYSMVYLSNHWVFDVFKYFISRDNIDFYIVHWCGFFLDLTGGFLLIFNKTRIIGFVFIGLFHLMNSQIFHIGMFPYVMIATMPLYCDYDWPLNVLRKLPFRKAKIICRKTTKIITENDQSNSESIKLHRVVPLIGIVLHFSLQLFLPFSQFLTPGYRTWTSGLYGYSWDMMVHNWRFVHNKVTVVDPRTGNKWFLDPDAWTQNYRWTHHADMVKQFAHCLEYQMRKKLNISEMEIYVDVWMSLNGRFAQRMYDPNVDILKASWSPVKKVNWVMPVLQEFSNWRRDLKQIEEKYLATHDEEVVFLADFPKHSLINYMEENLNNVKVNVLSGEIALEVLHQNWSSCEVVAQGETVSVPTGHFHRISPLQEQPACYFYVFGNRSSLL